MLNFMNSALLIVNSSTNTDLQMPFGSRLRQWVAEYAYHPPEKDEKTLVKESLLMELDFRIKELDQYYTAKEQEEKQESTGRVDYSWLATVTVPKVYEMPQLERLELEELCYKVKTAECGKIIGIFREELVNEPPVSKLPRIMRSAIISVLESRPKAESLTEWVTKRTTSLTSLRMSMRPNPKVTPIMDDGGDDIENQSTQLQTMNSPNQTFITYFHGHENEETIEV